MVEARALEIEVGALGLEVLRAGLALLAAHRVELEVPLAAQGVELDLGALDLVNHAAPLLAAGLDAQPLASSSALR